MVRRFTAEEIAEIAPYLPEGGHDLGDGTYLGVRHIGTRRRRMRRPPPPRRPIYFHVATIVSCIPDALYPYDPAVLRAVHEFDPRVIPVWVKKVYRAGDTGGLRSIGFHGIASHVWNPHGPSAPSVYKTLMPTSGFPRQRPTQVDFYHADRGRGELGWGYLPFDWRVFEILRSTYDEWSWKERRAYIDEHGEAAMIRKAREHAEAEAEYAAKSDGPWLKRQIDQFDNDDVKRALAGPQPYEARPMVEVHAPKEGIAP